MPLWVKLSPFVAMLIGLVTAWFFYIRSPETPRRLAEDHQILYRFLLNKWYFDELYDFLFVRPAKWLGSFLWKQGDVRTIDGYGPNGIAARAQDITGWVVRLQTGYLYQLCLRDADRNCSACHMDDARECILMTDWPLLSVVTFIPLICVLFLLPIKDDTEIGRRNIRQVALLGTTATFIMSLLIWASFDVSDPGFQMVESIELAGSGFSYAMGVDGISMLFVILTTFLMPLCILASWNSVQTRVREYMIAFLVLETLMIGVFCALDIVLFYVFFEAGLIPMFIIIGVWGGKRRVYASFKFFLYTLAGSVLMLLAIMAMFWDAGTTDIRLLLAHDFPAGMQTWLWLAFFASFAVKMPMWPVHTWLPDAHVEAPTAGSVILAGILLKLGGYGFLRFSLPMFPLASADFAPFIFTLSVIAIIYTSLVALMQEDIKKTDRLFVGGAYGLRDDGDLRRQCAGRTGRDLPDAEPRADIGGLVPLASASSTTGCTRARSRPMAGWSTTCRNNAVAFMILTMANVGLPGTSGFVGEFLTLIGVFQVNTWVAAFGRDRRDPVGGLCAVALSPRRLRCA